MKIIKDNQLNTNESLDLRAARDEWQDAKHNKKASKAMRKKRQQARGRQWHEQAC